MALEILEQQKLAARMFPKLGCFFIVIILMMIWSSTPAAAISFSSVTSVPGFPDSLPFKLETGYIGVGDAEFFYYFVESESNPVEDPLMLWINGGPGCSSLTGLAIQIGPVRLIDTENNGSLPTFELNPYSWTKVANLIFLDAPVPTGFSYFRSSQASETRDKRHANNCYNFLIKWLLSHPKFIRNPLYISGHSYSGKIVPIITRAISNGIEDGSVPFMNLKGYLLGNPYTDSKLEVENSWIPFYHRTALISDELYESAKTNCKEEYVEVDISNVMCQKDIQAIKECTAHINSVHILKPECVLDIQLANSLDNNRKSFLETSEDSCHRADYGCMRLQFDRLMVWANDISVQRALGIRMGTTKQWVGCKACPDYIRNVESTVGYHGYLNTKGYRALVYSGDHDGIVPYVGTEAWIKSLNLSIVDSWRPWFVDGQVGGYSKEFQNNFTFATVKGGGHSAPDYNPKECFAMFKRWISQQPL